MNKIMSNGYYGLKLKLIHTECKKKVHDMIYQWISFSYVCKIYLVCKENSVFLLFQPLIGLTKEFQQLTSRYVKVGNWHTGLYHRVRIGAKQSWFLFMKAGDINSVSVLMQTSEWSSALLHWSKRSSSEGMSVMAMRGEQGDSKQNCYMQ